MTKPSPRPGLSSGAQHVIDEVGAWPGTIVRIDDTARSASIYVGDRVVSRIGLRDETVTVYAPPDTLGSLVQSFPGATRMPEGIQLRLGDVAPEVILAAIQRRVRVERFAGQYREQSP